MAAGRDHLTGLVPETTQRFLARTAGSYTTESKRVIRGGMHLIAQREKEESHTEGSKTPSKKIGEVKETMTHPRAKGRETPELRPEPRRLGEQCLLGSKNRRERM